MTARKCPPGSARRLRVRSTNPALLWSMAHPLAASPDSVVSRHHSLGAAPARVRVVVAEIARLLINAQVMPELLLFDAKVVDVLGSRFRAQRNPFNRDAFPFEGLYLRRVVGQESNPH